MSEEKTTGARPSADTMHPKTREKLMMTILEYLEYNGVTDTADLASVVKGVLALLEIVDTPGERRADESKRKQVHGPADQSADNPLTEPQNVLDWLSSPPIDPAKLLLCADFVAGCIRLARECFISAALYDPEDEYCRFHDAINSARLPADVRDYLTRSTAAEVDEHQLRLRKIFAREAELRSERASKAPSTPDSTSE